MIDLKDHLNKATMKAEEGEKFAERAAILASENANLKSVVDELTSGKKVAEEKLQLLETVVQQRANNDDVAVLKAELQNVQKIMVEDLGERKEKQLEDYRSENESLKSNIVHLNSKIAKLEEETEELKDKFFNADAQAESLKVEASGLKSNLKKTETDLAKAKEDNAKKIEEIDSVKVELNSLQRSTNENLTVEQERIGELQVKTETLQNKLSGSESKVQDLTSEMETLQRHYDEQCQANDELKGQLCESQNNLKDLQRQKTNL